MKWYERVEWESVVLLSLSAVFGILAIIGALTLVWMLY